MQAVAERLAVDERHDVVRRAINLARVDQPQDVWVLQVGDGLDLAQEPLGADHRGELRPEDLDGDLAIVLQVLGEIHRGHAAGAQLPLDPVAVGQGERQSVGRLPDFHASASSHDHDLIPGRRQRGSVKARPNHYLYVG